MAKVSSSFIIHNRLDRSRVTFTNIFFKYKGFVVVVLLGVVITTALCQYDDSQTNPYYDSDYDFLVDRSAFNLPSSIGELPYPVRGSLHRSRVRATTPGHTREVWQW